MQTYTAPGSDTSREAAICAKAFARRQGLIVYRWLAKLENGTQKEAHAQLGIERHSLCGRFKALEDMGVITKTDVRRQGCVAYRVVSDPPRQGALW